MTIVAGVFSSRAQAESLLPDLRKIGIADEELDVIAGTSDRTQKGLKKQSRSTGAAAAHGIVPGALFATAVGAILLLIAGVNPIEHTVALVVFSGGIIVGGGLGALMAAMFNMGRSHDEALLYDEALKSGEVIAAVEVAGPITERVVHVFEEHKGRNVKSGNWRAPGWDHPFPDDSSITAL
ncbi:MAG: hypothetical protein KGN84_06880 [Acidobacteriota bacterium]|nr:hypothetical protein [Acidobacteriota bacterium]